jgi:hypothetical protein
MLLHVCLLILSSILHHSLLVLLPDLACNQQLARRSPPLTCRARCVCARMYFSRLLLNARQCVCCITKLRAAPGRRYGSARPRAAARPSANSKSVARSRRRRLEWHGGQALLLEESRHVRKVSGVQLRVCLEQLAGVEGRGLA